MHTVQASDKPPSGHACVCVFSISPPREQPIPVTSFPGWSDGKPFGQGKSLTCALHLTAIGNAIPREVLFPANPGQHMAGIGPKVSLGNAVVPNDAIWLCHFERFCLISCNSSAPGTRVKRNNQGGGCQRGCCMCCSCFYFSVATLCVCVCVTANRS